MLEPPVQDLLLRLVQGPVPTFVYQLFPYALEQYVRIIPRAQVAAGDNGQNTYWRWQSLATHVGQSLSATAPIRQFLAQIQDELSQQYVRVEPYIGQLDRITTQALADVLQRISPSTVPAYFLLRGHSGLGPDPELIYRGPIVLLSQLQASTVPWLETPAMCWSEDGTWCLTTPPDSPSAYFGGSAATIQAVLQDERIEGFAIPATTIVDDWLAQ